jgi:hypothetical protein
MLYSISIEDNAKPTPIVRCPNRFPVVSPDEKYVAYRIESGFRIVEIATKTVVVSYTLPVTGRTFLSWSSDGQELSVGIYEHDSGLWIYDMKAGKASKVIRGSFEVCSWSQPETGKMALGRTYWDLNEIWVADLDPNVSTAQALGPGRTIEQHYHEMVRHYTRRIDTEPEDARNYVARARFYIYLEDKEKAVADLDQCAKLLRSRDHPAMALITKLAMLYRERERYDEVEPVFDKVLAFSFHMIAYYSPDRLNRLALFQATFPSAEFRDAAKAVENATKACERTNWKNHEYISTLAAAYAETGDFDSAVKWQKEAVDLLPEEQSSWWRAEYQSRMKLYRAGKPYRQSP